MTSKLPPYPTEYLDIVFIEEKANENEYSKLQCEQNLPFAASEVFHAPLISVSNLTQENDVKKIMEICINVEGSTFIYQPGDTISILAQNCNKEINEIIDRLNYNKFADKLFIISVKETNTKKKFKIPSHVPVIGCIRHLLLRNLDIRTVPKKTFLRALSKYTSNEEEVNKLNELCSQEGSAKYTKFISEYVPLLEILKIFPSCFPPFTTLLEHLPRLLPRPYSITCSPLQFSPPYSQISFIYSLTLLPKSYEGVCTGWMNNLVDNAHDTNIPVYLRKANNFVLPENLETNLILIATGTGIAPFMSFLRHKVLEENKNSGSLWLFYGCRYANDDFLYKHEIEQYVDTGLITKLFTSFSRETSKTKYVQDNILQNAQSFVEMLENNTILYICGGKNMSKGVNETIVQCVLEIKNYTMEEAELFVSELKKSNKYIEDIWD